MKILFLILVFGLAKDTYSQRPEIVETELDSAFNLGNSGFNHDQNYTTHKTRCINATVPD